MQETFRKSPWINATGELIALPPFPKRPLRNHLTLVIIFGKDGLAMNAGFVTAFLLRFGSLAGITQADHLNLLLIMNGVGLYLYFFCLSGLYRNVCEPLFAPSVFRKLPVMLALHLGTVATLLLIINNVAISRLHLVLTYTLFWGLATLIRRVNRLSAQSTM